MDLRARLGLDHTGPHPSLFLWSPLPRAVAGRFTASQVPGAQGDRQGVPNVSGVQLVQTPSGSLSSRDNPRATSTREGENTGRSVGSTWGAPTTTPFYGPRGQGARPRSKSQHSSTGNPRDALLGRFRFGGAGPESWLLGGDLLRCNELLKPRALPVSRGEVPRRRALAPRGS